MNENIEKRHRSIYGYILFSLIFLFNPSISVIDVLPDFIAFFILARVFRYAGDCAPHFEEARTFFIRLGWLNFFKFFGLMIMVLVKRGNSSENDVIPLVTLVFALGEVILTFLAIKNIFEALFYLGNRGEALATITPVKVFGTRIGADTVRTLTYFFTAFKCLAYFAPTPFLLTKTNISATGRASLAKGFITVLIISQIVCIVVGIIWLIIMRKYALAIKNEGKFYPTLDTLLKNNKGFSLEKKEKLRAISFALSVFQIASIFTLELSLVENYDVNLVPHFIFAALLLFAVYRLSPFAKGALPAYVSGAVYFAISVATYILQTDFLVTYGYEGLITTKAARSAYPTITVLSCIEFISLVAFLFFIARMLYSFINAHTGINENSNSLKSNDSYFGSLKKKNAIFFGAGILMGLSKLISVITHGSVRFIYSDSGEELLNAIVSPAVEWIGLAVTVCAAVYIGVTLYFISTLKDEVKMKYEEA